MNWLELTTLAILPAFLLLDLVARRRAGRAASRWRLRALAVTAFNFWLTLAVGQAWATWTDGAALFDGTALGTAGGAVAGVLVYEFFHYWYHRGAHRFDALWRAGHQMHHSAERLDAWGAYFLHPLDAAIFTTISSVVFFPLMGLGAEAGAWAAAALTFLAVFQHARVRTPAWLGWIVQRPESHAIHHARGVHAWNYADLPLWDLVFGTFRNGPERGPLPEQGFYDGASRRIGAMLAFRDVSRPPAQRP